MLYSLKNDDQICETVSLIATSEQLCTIFCIVLVTKLFKNIENDLWVYARHPERLQKASQAFLEIAISVVLSFEVLLKTLLCVVIFTSDDFCNFIQADSTRV